MNNAAGSIFKERPKYHAACELVIPIVHAKQMAVKHLFHPRYRLPSKMLQSSQNGEFYHVKGIFAYNLFITHS